MITPPARIRHSPTLRQFIKFGLVGVVNTGMHASVYYVMSRGLHLPPLGANAVAFLIAVTISFGLNRRWTFRSTAAIHGQYVKFFTVSLAGFGWSELILYVLHYRFGWHDLVALGGSIVLVLFWNFSLNKFWTFRTA